MKTFVDYLSWHFLFHWPTLSCCSCLWPLSWQHIHVCVLMTTSRVLFLGVFDARVAGVPFRSLHALNGQELYFSHTSGISAFLCTLRAHMSGKLQFPSRLHAFFFLEPPLFYLTMRGNWKHWRLHWAWTRSHWLKPSGRPAGPKLRLATKWYFRLRSQAKLVTTKQTVPWF